MTDSVLVQPYVLAILLCDSIIIEDKTGKKTLVGLFDRVFAHRFPAAQRFGIYVKMTDAEGMYDLKVDYVNVSSDRIIESLPVGSVEVVDRLIPAELVLTLGAPIPEPGSYEFRIFANNSYLGRVAFFAELLGEERGG